MTSMTNPELVEELAAAKATYDTIEAELTANERMVDTLQFALRDAVSTATENARQRDEAKEQAERMAEALYAADAVLVEHHGGRKAADPRTPAIHPVWLIIRTALTAWEKSRG